MDISSRDLNINTTKNNNNGILIFEIFDDEFSDACEYKLMKIPLKFNLFTVNILILLNPIIFHHKMRKINFPFFANFSKDEVVKRTFYHFHNKNGFSFLDKSHSTQNEIFYTLFISKRHAYFKFHKATNVFWMPS